jgi:hypothetical protein
MPLIQRSRFTTFFKQLTGFKGPLSSDLDTAVQPTVDVNQRAPELDEEQAYWYAQPNSVAAVAAQLQAIGVKISGGQAVIDGFMIRSLAAGGIVIAGISAEFTADSATNGGLANNFLFGRGSLFNASQQTFIPIQTMNHSQVSSFILGVPLNFELQANVPLIVNLPPMFVIQPGWAFVLQGGAVNQGIGGAIWGRWLADQL